MCVIRMVSGDIAEAVDGDTKAWLGSEPRRESLGHTEVEEGGEGTTLANAS